MILVEFGVSRSIEGRAVWALLKFRRSDGSAGGLRVRRSAAPAVPPRAFILLHSLGEARSLLIFPPDSSDISIVMEAAVLPEPTSLSPVASPQNDILSAQGCSIFSPLS